ncbi:MAG: transporter [Moraxellaceae bacterium]|jgi:predicted MFS family arabinose efflux permease|nr:transporter [Moraxellaceae bacterium]
MSPPLLDAPREKRLILLLAGIQFCHIVDFMVLMPLGPQLMRLLDISTAEFGLLVAAYTLAAGLAGFAFAFVVDRFDRRRLLLGVFAGFLLATTACGLAWSFASLLLARLLAGSFGGILGANVMAYLGDCIPEERRGTATGKVMAAFSLAAVAGVPLGIFLAVHFNWRMPFLFVTAVGIVLGVLGLRVLPSVPARDTGPLDVRGTLQAVFSVGNHWRAFALIAAMMLAGFSVIPFISPYMVRNVGVAEAHLSLIYLFGGLATLFTAPVIGRLADRLGKARTVQIVGSLSLLPILALTHLPALPLPVVLLVTTFFMVLVSGRLIPTMALVTAASSPALRGRFLSMNAALQQLAASLAAFWPTLVLAQGADGRMLHYNLVGYGATAMTLLALWLAGKVEVRS